MSEVPIESVNCLQFFDKAEDPDTCKCKGIVMNTYGTLRRSGVNEREAVQIATRVLRHHHPSPSVEAKTVVECWVFETSQRQAN